MAMAAEAVDDLDEWLKPFLAALGRKTRRTWTRVSDPADVAALLPAWFALRMSVGARSRRDPGRVACLELGRYASACHQAPRRPPPPHPAGPLPGAELARVRGRAEAPRRPDALAGRGGDGRLAGAAAEHARRPSLVLGRGDRAGADAAPRLPPRPAPGRGLRGQRAPAARAGVARARPHDAQPPRPRLRRAPARGRPARPDAPGDRQHRPEAVRAGASGLRRSTAGRAGPGGSCTLPWMPTAARSSPAC